MIGIEIETGDRRDGAEAGHCPLPLRFPVITQSQVVAHLTLLVAITVSHRPCSVAAGPLHRRLPVPTESLGSARAYLFLNEQYRNRNR